LEGVDLEIQIRARTDKSGVRHGYIPTGLDDAEMDAGIELSPSGIGPRSERAVAPGWPSGCIGATTGSPGAT